MFAKSATSDAVLLLIQQLLYVSAVMLNVGLLECFTADHLLVLLHDTNHVRFSPEHENASISIRMILILESR